MFFEFGEAGLAFRFFLIVGGGIRLVAGGDRFLLFFQLGGFGNDGEDGAFREGLQVGVEAGQFFGSGFADVGDAHREEPAVERHFGAGVLEGVEQGLGPLFAEASLLGGCFSFRILGRVEHEVGEIVEREVEEIEGGGSESRFDQLLGDRFAQAIEVEGFAAAEVLDGGDGLRGAGEVDAAPGDKAFWLFDRAVAGGALMIDVLGEGKRFAVRRPFFETTRSMAGMISPAFSTTTVSLMRMSLR